MSKPDTKFRSCKFQCGRTIWTEIPVVCADCKGFLSEVARRNRQAKKLRERKPLPAAVARGRAATKAMTGR